MTARELRDGWAPFLMDSFGARELVWALNDPLEHPLVIDALQGTLWLQRERGTLWEYGRRKGLPEVWALYERTRERIRDLLDTGIPEEATEPRPGDPLNLPGIGMVLGTYRWNGDPQVIHRASDLGIRCVDTAESYGYGREENRLAEILASPEGPDLRVFCKASRNHNSTSAFLGSYRRSAARFPPGALGAFFLHWPTEDPPPEAAVEAFEHLECPAGVSNCSVDLLCRILSAQVAWRDTGLLAHYRASLQVVQVPYNLTNRGAELALIPFCRAHGIRVLGYSALGQDFQQAEARMTDPVFREVVDGSGGGPAAAMLNWVRWQDVVPIFQTNSLAHLEANVAGLGSLSLSALKALNRRFPIGADTAPAPV